jgi:UDP-N-acetyl-D-mannosaminuronic acid dehydrogenase
MVILKSTVPPLTTVNYIRPLIESTGKHVRLAFCPERLAEGSAIAEFLSVPVVVGGIDAESGDAAVRFWQDALGVEAIQVGSTTAAEMVKLADNWWIDLNIALAGELAMLADKLGIDVLDVIGAANSLPKGNSHVNILLPSVGVGGYCLTKDPWFVQHMGEENGLSLVLPKNGRQVNDSMPLYCANMIDSILSQKGKARQEMKIAVLGIAFKNNTGDCRYTPTKPCIDRLVALGYRMAICDPLAGSHDREMVTSMPPVAAEKAIEGADCVAFLAGHDVFRQMPIDKIASLANPGALVFDGRMFFSKNKIEEIRRCGLHSKGAGR